MSVYNENSWVACWLGCWRDGFRINGRLRRKDFWSFTIVLYLVFALVATVGYYCDNLYWYIYPSILCLLSTIPLYTATIRRLHDVGISGWWVLLGSLVLFICLIDGESCDNKYGPCPKNSDSDILKKI
jgi:uncharacterized membrane protein YhaH (DUF805 family)